MMHAPRKRFGQHFLEDTSVIERLVNCIQPEVGQNMVEIGPGQGALTFPVLEKIKKLTVIELDRDLIPILELRAKQYGELDLHQGDVLKFDFESLNFATMRVIGNLPYNISTPLIFHLLTFANRISDMYFMLQKEVVLRLAANPSNSNYGRLSIMVQYHCKVDALFEVPATAFNPPPKVDSMIVRLIPHKQLPAVANDYDLFAIVVRTAFSQRRKTLRNTLKTLVNETIWQQSGINSSKRPEELSVTDYVNLSNLLTRS